MKPGNIIGRGITHSVSQSGWLVGVYGFHDVLLLGRRKSWQAVGYLRLLGPDAR